MRWIIALQSWEMEKSNETVNYYPTISYQETKKKLTNKHSNLLISCEKFSCLIRSKKKKQNKTKSKNKTKRLKSW